MASFGTYYIDAPTLTSANAVYLDINLQECAPDGFYSDGLNVRQQVDCKLLESVICPPCVSPCGSKIVKSNVQGVFNITIELGEYQGVSIIEFNTFENAVGIQATYNSTIINKLSSPIVGMLEGSAGLPTFIGMTSKDCGIVAESPYTLDEYNFIGGDFVPAGAVVETIGAGQIQTTTLSPQTSTMVISKPNITPTQLYIKIVAPCPESSFSIDIKCYEGEARFGLMSYYSSMVARVDSPTACADETDTVYYYHPVTSRPGGLNVYDFVFGDLYGVNPLADGWYKTLSGDTYEVTEGIVTDLLTCL